MKSRLLFEKGHNLNTGLIQTELLEVKKQADVQGTLYKSIKPG